MVDDVAYLMQMVISTLSDDRVLGRQVKEVDMCRMVDSRCPCYEAQSRTYFFMTDWRIIYDSMLMYEFE